jgi:hypothetical protein
MEMKNEMYARKNTVEMSLDGPSERRCDIIRKRLKIDVTSSEVGR